MQLAPRDAVKSAMFILLLLPFALLDELISDTGELVDVVERVNQVSSSLLSDTEEVLTQISAQKR